METKKIRAILGHHVDTLGKKRNGNYLVRYSYFYTAGYDESDFAAKIQKLLPDAKIMDSGNIWKPFKENANISNQSHWWVEFKI